MDIVINRKIYHMKLAVFTPDRWVKIIINGEVCLGRTYLHHPAEPNEPFYHLVHCLSPSTGYEAWSFYACNSVKYLRFGPATDVLFEDRLKTEELTTETIVDLIILPRISDQKIRSLAGSLCKHIHQN